MASLSVTKAQGELLVAARNAANTQTVLAYPTEYVIGFPAQPLAFWLELSAELKALTTAVEQRIQELEEV